MQDYVDQYPVRGPGRSPMRAVHDFSGSLTFPDTDSGFSSSLKSKSRLLNSDDFPSPRRMVRSNSMTRLNMLNGDASASPSHSPVVFDRTLKGLQDSLDDSENRRSVLMHKLKEAQNTLQLQNNRLTKLESISKENGALVEDLKFKEREYRKKIAMLEQSEEEKESLKEENIRLREQMQDRIDTLDFQLRSLLSQQQVATEESSKRGCLLDQTTKALTLLEEENCKLQKERDDAQAELEVVKEALHLSKTRFLGMDDENRTMKASADHYREENTLLSRKLHEMAGQMMELRNLLKAVKEENENLSSSWKHSSDDKHRVSQQVEDLQNKVSDLQTQLAVAMRDKERAFQDRLELTNKIQQLMAEKEHLTKERWEMRLQVRDLAMALDRRTWKEQNQALETELNDHEAAVKQVKMADNRRDGEIGKLSEELQAVKKVSGELSTELGAVRQYYERALEQISMLENGKSSLQQQQELMEQERDRLQAENDRLRQLLEGRGRHERQELEEMEDTLCKMKSEMKQLRYEKSSLEDRNHELEIKLRKANEELREEAEKSKAEMDSFRSSCDRLTSSVGKKETEIGNLTEKCRELEAMLARSKEEIRKLRSQCEDLADRHDDVDRLKDENRRLLQEKAENEQMIQLLETQKEVLTKSYANLYSYHHDAMKQMRETHRVLGSESSLNRLHDVEQLSGKIDQVRHENEVLRDRIAELEKVRDNLVREKEELLKNSELVYKQPVMEELEAKIDEMREANRQLREINNVMSEKLEIVEQENFKLKRTLDEVEGSGKHETERMRQDYNTLTVKFDRLKEEYEELDDKHQRTLTEYRQQSSTLGRDSEELVTVRKQKVALEKKVTLLNGQLNLTEGSKRRAEEEASKARQEVIEMRRRMDTTEKKYSEADTVLVSDLERKVHTLTEKLNKSEAECREKEKTIKSLNEESLEDVSSELVQVKDKLHELMGEIESKDQAIEGLETQLKTSQEQIECRDKAMAGLKQLLENLEDQNKSLTRSVEELRDSQRAENKPTLPLVETLKDELEEAIRKKSEGTPAKSMAVESPASRRLTQPRQPPSGGRRDPGKWQSGSFGTQYFQKPDSADAEGSDRLKTLISKYRSYSDQPSSSEQRSPRMSGLSLTTGRLGARVRPFGNTSPRAPMIRDDKRDRVDSKKSSSPARGDHPGGGATAAGAAARDAEFEEGEGMMDSQEQKDINALIQKYLKVLEM